MARETEQDKLRGCPTCSTKVSEAQMGLRDYSAWLSEHMPGRVSGADIDCVLEQHKTGRMLVFEFKRKGQMLPTGQRLLLQGLAIRGVDVWVAWEDDTHVEVGELSKDGEVLFVERMTKAALGRKARKWWNLGLGD
jgi:hypothetical protein